MLTERNVAFGSFKQRGIGKAGCGSAFQQCQGRGSKSGCASPWLLRKSIMAAKSLAWSQADLGLTSNLSFCGLCDLEQVVNSKPHFPLPEKREYVSIISM